MVADFQIQMLSTATGFENPDEVFQGWIAARPEHPPDAFFILMELIGNSRKGFGGVEVISNQAFSGLDITLQQNVRCLDDKPFSPLRTAPPSSLACLKVRNQGES